MADRNDIKGLFSALKAIYGPKTNMVIPVKSTDGSKTYTDKDEIIEQWKQCSHQAAASRDSRKKN